MLVGMVDTIRGNERWWIFEKGGCDGVGWPYRVRAFSVGNCSWLAKGDKDG